MVKTYLLVFIAVTAILVTLSESAQIPSKEGAKVPVISKTKAEEDVQIPEKSELASKVPENTVIVPKENTNLPVFSAISLYEPEEVLSVAEPQKESTEVKPMIAAIEVDEETSGFLDAHPDLIFVGSRQGKRYFYQPKLRDYASAKSACKDAGLKLVEIANKNEANYVWKITPVELMWTSGKDSDHFIWENSGRPVTLPIIEEPSDERRLQFDARTGATRKQLLAKLTTAKAYPLCQKL